MANININNATNPAIQRNNIPVEGIQEVGRAITTLAATTIIADVKTTVIAQTQPPAQISAAQQNAYQNQASYTLGLFGLPVFDFVTLTDPTLPANITFATVLITVQQTRNIVKTPIQGSSIRTTIKEYISNTDFKITLDITLNSNDIDVSPDAIIQQVQAYNTIENAVTVVCPYLNENFGVNQIVIEDYTYSPIEGDRGTKKLQLNCVSDFSDNIQIYQINVPQQ